MDFDSIDTLVDTSEYSEKELGAIIRAISGSKLSTIKDFKDVFKRCGITVNGEDEVFAREVFLNALIVLSSEEGENINLSLDRAIVLAKGKKKCITNKVSFEELVVSVVGGTVEDIDKSDDIDKESNSNKSNYTNKELNSKIKSYYSVYAKGVINVLLDRYKGLFQSGYEVIKPTGLLSNNSIIGLSGNSKKVKEFSIATQQISSILYSKMNIREESARSNINIADRIYNSYIQGSNTLLYFPNKLLEFVYGRKSPTGDNQESVNTYESHSNSSNWDAYSKSEVFKSLENVVMASILKFVYSTAKNEDYFNAEMADNLKGFLDYFKNCLSCCILMVNYREGVAFKIRICDPLNSLGDYDITNDILKVAYLGDSGKVPFSYKPRIEESRCIKEYAHEFNRDMSQASPLFAYKALQALHNQGIKPSWNDMILGMQEDGSILKNGTKGVALQNALTHHICAGSRAGKGLLTLNIVASGIYSNKAIFYLDNKPDMASMFKNLCDSMFVLNGNDCDEQYDTFNKFRNLDSILNKDNIPSYILEALGVEDCSWKSLGSLFYMRALKLVIGIIQYRAECSKPPEELNGKDGILLVVDEMKNFQVDYTNLINRFISRVPPSTFKRDLGKLNDPKLKDGEKESYKFNFDLSYNNANYYSLSYLNSLNEDLGYLYQRTDSAFNKKEYQYSDIFAIGQHLEFGRLSDYRLFGDSIANSSSSSRYRNVSYKGLSTSGAFKNLDLKSGSFPYSMLSYKDNDAFFGRNMEDNRDVYLAQKNKESKAYGKLDDKAGNFAYYFPYTESTRNLVLSGNVKKNIEFSKECVYFKPFLILNDAKQGDSYTEYLFTRCSGAEVGEMWLSREEVIAENPNEDGTFLNSAVGFESYLNMMGVQDIPSRLAKSGDIANYVVKKLGYNGTWFDLVTDLRPEWLFTVEDIVIALKGGTPKVCNPSTNPILKEFVEFNPSLFESSSQTEEEVEANSVSDYYDSEESESSSQTEEVEVNSESDYYDSEESESSSQTEEKVEVNSEEEEFDLFGEDEKDSVSNYSYDEGLNSYNMDSSNVDLSKGNEDDLRKSNFNSSDIDEIIRRLRSMGYNVTPKTESEKAYENKGTTDYNYSSSEETDFNERLEFDGDINSYADLVAIISNDIINKFGGLENITTFRVIGGNIVVNNYFYRCKASDLFVRNLPLDIRSKLNSGDLSCLFNYGLLHSMPRLRCLEFDSISIVYDYVSLGMGYGNRVSIDLFFNDLRGLQTLIIGKNLFERNSYRTAIKGNDIFYNPRFCTKMADASEEILSKLGGSAWKFTKDSFNSDKYGAVSKFLRVSGGLVVTTIPKVGEYSIKGGRKLFNGLKNFGKSLKKVLDETKKY